LKKLTALATAQTAGRLALSKKGFDVKILKLVGLSSVCDYFVIVSGGADVHVKAIAREIEDGLHAEGVKALHREGYDKGSWVLLDYIDVVVHVFLEGTRSKYALERLWGDAEIEELSE